jgi:ubiquinone biosynthesis protein COQ9
MSAAEMDGADATLDALRLTLAPRVAAAAAFDGWSAAAVEAAADETGTDRELAAYAFRSTGTSPAMAMITAWSEAITRDMQAAYPPESLTVLPIRERIRRLVAFRLDAQVGYEEALRRALSIMVMPQNVGAALRTGWASADAMWRLAGDRATDYNYYTKRTILAGVYAATLAVFPDDQSEDKSDTHAFLARRIDGIMRFEKAKSRLTRSGDDGFSIVRLLGRLRYPAR